MHGQGRAIGGELEQHRIVGREYAVMHRADVEYADHCAVDEQWHADEEVDSLFQQDRIEYVAVIDVIQDDRSRLRGDAAREAPANGDADALRDFFLQPARGGGDEVTRGAVKQEHRGGVGIQDLLHPAQQFDEEIIGAEVGQRRIRNRPDVAELVRRAWRRAERRGHQERLMRSVIKG